MTHSEAKVLGNVVQLVQAGIATLQAAGWTEEQIVPHIRYLTDEAFKFLSTKAA